MATTDLRGHSGSAPRRARFHGCGKPSRASFRYTNIKLTGSLHFVSNSLRHGRGEKAIPSPSFHKYRRAQESLRRTASQYRAYIAPLDPHDVSCITHQLHTQCIQQDASSPVVPVGNTAVSIAMCPWSTRVNARFSSGVGVPKCHVRVTSVVPSAYCAAPPRQPSGRTGRIHETYRRSRTGRAGRARCAHTSRARAGSG
jgi:hypothetical protein